MEVKKRSCLSQKVVGWVDFCEGRKRRVRRGGRDRWVVAYKWVCWVFIFFSVVLRSCAVATLGRCDANTNQGAVLFPANQY